MSVEEIAKGLTEAQRRFVLAGRIFDQFSMVTVRHLIRKRLFHVVPDSPNGRYGSCVPTDLGQSVRAYLKEQSDG